MASTGTICDTDCKLWLSMDGANDSTTFTDKSSVPKTVTAYGNAKVSTAYKKFGTGSLVLDGSSYLKIPDSADWDIGTSEDETLDFQIMFPGSAANVTLVSRNNGANSVSLGFFTGANYIEQQLHASSGSYYMMSFTTNQWYHLAAVRGSGNLYLFVDGTSVYSGGATTDSSSRSTDTAFCIGGLLNLAESFSSGATAYIDEFRYIKGTAVWTSDFTPPSAAYSAPPKPKSQIIWID